ncbi:polysaccharide deacetylase family protein [Parabacteroides distasonis]|uniref:polysaccharide deacetylase family protein n=1 Tax=Parabacteroides distasonis TaxID=823 RepID=UPI0018A9AD66|nr:polysaccharide deacetylase family protein [Parabacteroides distasonis]
MRRTLLVSLYFVAYYLGILTLFYRINRKKQRILVFHHIIPDEYMNNSFEQAIVCTSRSRFDWMMSIVNRRFEVTTELGRPASVIITFDDGYRAALIADEVLMKRSNKAYFFMPISNVGSSVPLWIDRIMAWFAYVPEGEYTIVNRKVRIGDSLSRQRAFSSLINTLYEKYDRDSTVEMLGVAYPYEALPIDPAYFDLRFKGLTEEELLVLKQKGHKIGGHSVRHDILSMLDERELRSDFKACSERVGYLYNTDLYAYPYGHKRDVTPRVIKECAQSAFAFAVMNEYNAEASEYSLSRMNISHYHSRFEIEASLSGFTQWLKNG